MSEFGATIVENFHWLVNNPTQLVNHDELKQIKNDNQPFLEALANLNNKNPNASPSPEHVHTVLEKVV